MQDDNVINMLGLSELMNKISYMTIFAAMVTALGLGSFVTPVFSQSDQAALESIDGYLEECIKELEAGNAEGGLTQCQSADDELDALLGNGNSTG
jgi:hypothetical protein